MSIALRDFTPADVSRMTDIWNQVVEDGVAFPQVDTLNEDEALEFFSSQTASVVATDDSGRVVGLYILHPNNIGRAGSIANASYAVDRASRGMGVGRALVSDCLLRAGAEGFRVLQFNAVVASNSTALALYRKLGFVDLGVVPACFHTKDGTWEDIHVMYHVV